MDHDFMKTRPIIPLIAAMSLPNILSMLINSLYNIVDSYFVAKISEDAMTSISIVFPLQNLSLSIAVGFSIGMNALIALYLGMGDHKRANNVASVGVVLCLLHGILVSLLCKSFLSPFLSMYTESESIFTMGLQYANIVLLFAPILHIYIGVEKVYHAVGRMKSAMFSMMFGCIANIILDPILIFGMGPIPAMGIAGAAWATGIGQVLELLVYCILYFARPLPVKIGFKYFHIEKNVLGRLYCIGIPASLNMALPSLLVSVLNSILTVYGGIYITILGIYYKLQTFVYMPANGLIQGIRPLVGFNFGAKEYGRVKKIYHVSLAIAACMMCIGTAICFIFPRQLMSLFAESPETIEEGAKALRIISIGFAASAVSITACGCLEGLGMGVHSLIIALLRYTVLIIPIAYFLSIPFQATGVWNAFWITEILAAALAYIFYKKAYAKKVAANQKEVVAD